MKIVIILSENQDFVESLKHSLAYTSDTALKFHFYMDLERVKQHIAHVGIPDLLLCDKGFQQDACVSSLKLRTAILTDKQTSSLEEVFIYQRMENFIIEVNKIINLGGEVQGLQMHSIEQQSKAIWVLDPCEGAWSKSCFSHLVNAHYAQSESTVCMDVSAFGCSKPHLNHIHYSDFSELIGQYLWSADSLEPLKNHMQSSIEFHYINAVKNPMDLLTLDVEFLDMLFEHLTAGMTNQILYSGLLGEAQLKRMVRHFDHLLIVTQESTISATQLKQIQDWFSQIAPKLTIKLYHAQHDLEGPEKLADRLMRWSDLRQGV